MPEYIYNKPNTKKYITVFQSMNEDHVYTDEDGLNWDRVWQVPQGATPIKLECDDLNGFVNTTAQKRGTLGNVLDLSEEMSQKRAERNEEGRDKKYKDAYFEKWSKARHGKSHPLDDR